MKNTGIGDLEAGIGERGVVAALGFEKHAQAEFGDEIARPDAAGDQHAVERLLAAVGGDDRDLVAVEADVVDGGGDEPAARARPRGEGPCRIAIGLVTRPRLRREQRAGEAALQGRAPWRARRRR